MTRSLAPSEHASQCAIFAWARLAECRYPELRLLMHVPNGGSRHRVEAARFREAGVKAGVPDIFLDCARGGYHGLRIELKAPGGKVSPSQVAWLDALRDENYFTRVCWSAEDAIAAIEFYLRLGTENFTRG